MTEFYQPITKYRIIRTNIFQSELISIAQQNDWKSFNLASVLLYNMGMSCFSLSIFFKLKLQLKIFYHVVVLASQSISNFSIPLFLWGNRRSRLWWLWEFIIVFFEFIWRLLPLTSFTHWVGWVEFEKEILMYEYFLFN